MPMNGGGTSSRVPGAAASPNATIKSADYNAEMDDVYNILNTARPIAYGGTGATDAAGARTNLGIPESVSTGEAFRGHLYGLTLSNNATDATNDIDIASGSAASDGTTPAVMALATALTKRLDAAWAVGSGNGGLDAGTIADTTYHVWLIQRSDTGVVDALFSTSASSPTMPTNYDRKRRIGSILRVSGAIVAFSQNGDEFLVKTPVKSYEGTVGTTATTAPLVVPIGIVVNALVHGYIVHPTVASATVLVSSLAQSDNAPGAVNHTVMAQVAVEASAFIQNTRTNTSAQVRVRSSNADTTVSLTAQGWIDTRGRM